MAHTHQSHLFSHEWFELHPKLLPNLKKFCIPLGMGTLFAVAALQMATPELATSRDPSLVSTMDVSVYKTDSSMSGTGYLPDQFVEQAKQAKIEELPAQF